MGRAARPSANGATNGRGFVAASAERLGLLILFRHTVFETQFSSAAIPAENLRQASIDRLRLSRTSPLIP